LTIPAILMALAAAADPGPKAPLPLLGTVAEAQAALRPQEHALLVHFWALWCAPCLAELPAQAELAREARAEGADVLFINLDPPEASAKVVAQLEKVHALDAARHVQLSQSVDPEAVTRLLDPKWNAGLPATFALLPGGAVGARALGPLSRSARENLLGTIKAQRAVQPAAHP
jgi:thiol-disulfide isomerase/thioredoxin